MRGKGAKRSPHSQGSCEPAPASLGPNPGLGQTDAHKLTGNYMETAFISSAEVPAICLKEVEIKPRCLWGRREGGGVKIILG